MPKSDRSYGDFMKKNKLELESFNEFKEEMNSETEISLSEWQEAFDVACQNDPGYTITELSELLGLSRSATKNRIEKALKNKKILQGKSTRGNRTYSVYQIKKGK